MNKKILLIETDSFLADMYAYKFSELGFDTEVLKNGDGDIAEKVLEINPDIISINVILSNGKDNPELAERDGFNVIKELKKDERTKNIPFVFLTNMSRQIDIEKGRKLGAFDYLIMADFKPNEVSEIISGYLENSEGYKSPYENKDFLEKLKQEKKKDQKEWNNKYPKPSFNDRLGDFMASFVVFSIGALKLIGILILIGLGVWLVIALGPLWIIAIVLVLIFLALTNRR